VIGIEGDLGYMGQPASGVIASSNPIYHQDAQVNGGLYGDIKGRTGIVVERTLFYGKGGFAFLNGRGSQVTTKPGYQPSDTGTFTGWVYGGGIEHSLGQGWSLKVEYLHFDFGTRDALQTSITDPPIGFQYRNSFDLTTDTVKLGLNYRF
jgi:outer membrane immunogenic protein